MYDLHKIYPFNLARDVFGEGGELDIWIPGVEEALNTLSDREYDIIKKRYKEGRTLQEIGDEYGLTGERIRQIIAKAKRKLRHPSRMKLMKAVQFKTYNNAVEMYSNIKQECEIMRQTISEVNNTKPKDVMLQAKRRVVIRTPLEELGLSVRSLNALQRAGKRTLEDVIRLSREELLSLKNIGHTSIEDIEAAIARYGLKLREM